MHWVARYKDNTALNQFKNGQERLFKEIQEDKLTSFVIYDERNELLNVNLLNGDISFRGIVLEFPDFSGSEFRLIYFRRVKQTFGNGKEPTTTTNPYLGWQTTIDGKNYQRKLTLEGDKIKLLSR